MRRRLPSRVRRSYPVPPVAPVTWWGQFWIVAGFIFLVVVIGYWVMHASFDWERWLVPYSLAIFLLVLVGVMIYGKSRDVF